MVCTTPMNRTVTEVRAHSQNVAAPCSATQTLYHASLQRAPVLVLHLPQDLSQSDEFELEFDGDSPQDRSEFQFPRSSQHARQVHDALHLLLVSSPSKCVQEKRRVARGTHVQSRLVVDAQLSRQSRTNIPALLFLCPSPTTNPSDPYASLRRQQQSDRHSEPDRESHSTTLDFSLLRELGHPTFRHTLLVPFATALTAASLLANVTLHDTSTRRVQHYSWHRE